MADFALSTLYVQAPPTVKSNFPRPAAPVIVSATVFD